VVAYENASRFVELQTLSRTDTLTSLNNRRSFFELAERRLQRSTDDVVAVMIDIDRFKSINDEHGHRVGDQVIREIAARLDRSVRQRDVLGRYGGEEFAVLATARTTAEGHTLGERLRTAVADRPVDTDAGPLDVTVSIGVHRPTEPGGTADRLLNVADRALYEAKRAGRNRVVVDDGPSTTTAPPAAGNAPDPDDLSGSG
jgi:diguanylate cyclase (GGDEF)-like protein